MMFCKIWSSGELSIQLSLNISPSSYGDVSQNYINLPNNTKYKVLNIVYRIVYLYLKNKNRDFSTLSTLIIF